ncbi:hypothetical protein [Streptomyces panaciradicis]|uniref:hypothetical protein n=1 Tax=Streptomyces panaciradicis TaxID=1470261 RepID=UPI00201CCEC4|nr:hypothetical protein [Streptomyces panaciradicis]
MTQRARHKETGTSLGSVADVPGSDVASGKGEVLEFLGLTLAACAFALIVAHPEACEALVHTLATGAGRLAH